MIRDNFIQICLYTTYLLSTIVVFLIIFIIVLRFYKTNRNQKKNRLQQHISDLVNNYLFNDELNKVTASREFRSNCLKNTFAKKIAIKEFLSYHENFKGEARSSLASLFRELQLDRYTCELTKSNKWHQQARAIHTAGVMKININKKLLDKALNHKRFEVKEQAMLYFLRTAKSAPLSFLDSLDGPLTLWQQAFIENGLKLWYKGIIPDFSEKLNHNEVSVVTFSMYLMGLYNQFESTNKLLPFLKNSNEKIRKSAIITLAKLQYKPALPELVTSFKNETKDVKKEIILFIKKLGDKESLYKVQPFIKEYEWNLKQLFFKTEKDLSMDLN